MPFFGFFYDQYYFLLVIPAVIFALWAQFNVQGTYKKYSKVFSMRGYTGASVARTILDNNGLNDVRIEHIQGKLTDHYDPRSKVVRLSDKVYLSTSVAALGIAAHEAGHALQHAKGYSPLKIRNSIIPITQIGSNLAMPLIILGFIFSSFSFLIDIGIWLFLFVVLFQLITLPVEFNASRRAITTLGNMGAMDNQELAQTKKVLKAAAMTYVAALAVALANFLRLILLFGGRRRNN